MEKHRFKLLKKKHEVFKNDILWRCEDCKMTVLINRGTVRQILLGQHPGSFYRYTLIVHEDATRFYVTDIKEFM